MTAEKQKQPVEKLSAYEFLLGKSGRRIRQKASSEAKRRLRNHGRVPGVERGAGFDKKPRAKRRGVCEITAARFAPAPPAGGKSGRRGFEPPPPETPFLSRLHR